MKRRIALWLSTLALAASPIAAPAQAPAAAGEPPVLGLIVKLKPGAAREAPQAARERVAGVAQRRGVGYHQIRAGVLGTHLLRSGGAIGMDEARTLAQRLLADPDVEWVAANTLERRLATPNDPLYANQWWLHGRDPTRPAVPNLPAAWDLTTGSDDVVVAVLDSGIRRFHPEFTVGATRLLQGYDFVSEVEYANDGNGIDPDPADPGDFVSAEDKVRAPAIFGGCEVADSTWHGTVIAGQIAAPSNDGHGIAGVTWRGKLLPVRVAGKCGAAVHDIVEGMLWAAGIDYTGSPPRNPNPARVINLSFGGNRPCDVNSTDPLVRGTARLYTETIAALRQKGALFVAAAGNEGTGVVRPAGCAGALAVTALARNGTKADYANIGPEVAVATVGGTSGNGIYSTTNDGATGPTTDSYDYYEGTSFAAPIVAGTAALMLAANPALSVDQLFEGIRASARDHIALPGRPTCSSTNRGSCNCTTDTCGAGALDAPGAVAWAQAASGNFEPSDPCVTFRPDRLGGGSVPCGNGDGGGGGGGGGALGPLWLLALALAAARLSAARRRR